MKNTQGICSQTDSPENNKGTEMAQLVKWEMLQNHFKAASVGGLELINIQTIQEFGKTPSMFHNKGLDTQEGVTGGRVWLWSPTTVNVPLRQVWAVPC